MKMIMKKENEMMTANSRELERTQKTFIKHLPENLTIKDSTPLQFCNVSSSTAKLLPTNLEVRVCSDVECSGKSYFGFQQQKHSV